MKPLTPNTPHVIIMVGIPGSGKTTFAEHFAKTFEAPYINPGTISQLTGINAEATEKVTKLLFDELLKTNRTLIYEGSTYLRSQRTALENMVKKAGYKVLFVWVQTDPAESKRRATRRQNNRTPMSSEAFDASFGQFQNPSQAEKPVVISGKHTYATQLKVVLKRLAVPRQDVPSIPKRPDTASGRNITVR